MHVAREFYGSVNQTFIIDGSGVYVTRNSASYAYGRFQLSDNVCYGNGINGLVAHKTDRALITNNVLFSNGQVSKEAPSLRQAYAGLTLNHAINATVFNNAVSANDDDNAYIIGSGSTFEAGGATGSNVVCGGMVQAGFLAYVERICQPPPPPAAPPVAPPPLCSPCDDIRDTYMATNNKTCATWTWAHTNRCNASASWRSAR
eukprot:3108716-Prymnesium_polylepis.2